MEEHEEYELKKKAIFDSMSLRGRERILKIGYENWEPFPMPKDPRERIFGGASQKARGLVQEFSRSHEGMEGAASLQKELFELARGLIQDEARAKTVIEFSAWLRERMKEVPTEE